MDFSQLAKLSQSIKVKPCFQAKYIQIKSLPRNNKIKVQETDIAPKVVASGLEYLSEDAKERAQNPKANKFEKLKVKKCGSNMWVEINELAQMIREGKTSWEDVNLDDIDIRLKWAGLFHRRKRTPGKFMMRLKVPNGILNSEQLSFLGDSIVQYGKDGCADITTRANIQLRGVTLESADSIYNGLQKIGLSSVMSGMDNVRNVTGSPIAGLDPHELIDTIPFTRHINDMHTNHGAGNVELANLPRKLNISFSASRDDFVHSHINDLAYEAVYDKQTGQVGFNILVGGYFSVKRNTASIPLNCFVTQEQAPRFAIALLEVFRDYGPRLDRQKTRLIWLVEEMGIDEFKKKVAQYMGIEGFRDAVEVKYEGEWKRRDLLGVHNQKQDGLVWVGVQVPVGRLQAQDFYDFANITEKFGDGTIRLTPDQKVIFPNVDQSKVEAMLQQDLFKKFKVEPGILVGNLVSCVGAQFCGLALIETKNRALKYVNILQQELDFEKPVRIHWTGCPNSCGQAQVADIGIMGGPAKLNGKAVEGVRIFTGGQIGENAKLASEFEKGIPVQEDILIPRLKSILIEQFGAKPKQQ